MYRVMIVDDEPAILKGLTELIDWTALDLEIVTCATSGLEALSLLQKVPIHILITDVCMPQMDGLSLLHEAKTLHPALRCIVISAHDQFEYVHKALKFGVENYMLKPINPHELRETLTKAIENIRITNTDSTAQSFEMLAFRNNILDRWVNDSLQDFELSERAALLDIDLNAKEFLVCIIGIIPSINFSEKLQISSKLLLNIRNYISDTLNAEVFLDRNMNVVILLRGNELLSQRSQLHSVFSLVKNDAESIGHSCYITVGPVVQSAYSTGNSYQQAYSLQSCRYLNGGKSPIFFHDFLTIERSLSADVLRFEQALENLDMDSAYSSIKKFIFPLKNKPFSTLYIESIPLLLKIIARFDNMQHEGTEMPEILLRQLEVIKSNNNFVDFETNLYDIVKSAITRLNNLNNKFHPVIKRALDIIRNSYPQDISLKTVADQINMNPSYFGQLFKAETGELFNDYLTNIRLREARNLLSQTNLKIADIISRIGISQQSYFNRIFKKEYGLTPVEFRRTMQ